MSYRVVRYSTNGNGRVRAITIASRNARDSWISLSQDDPISGENTVPRPKASGWLKSQMEGAKIWLCATVMVLTFGWVRLINRVAYFL